MGGQSSVLLLTQNFSPDGEGRKIGGVRVRGCVCVYPCWRAWARVVGGGLLACRNVINPSFTFNDR